MSLRYREQDQMNHESECWDEELRLESGVRVLLTRMRMTPEEVVNLSGGAVFENALRDLGELESADLLEVMDGGLDKERGELWVKSRWRGGSPLLEEDLREGEIRALSRRSQILLEDLAEKARSVSFNPARIWILREVGGEASFSFTIDYLRWFRNAAAQRAYWEGEDEVAARDKLLEGLVIRQLKIPNKVGEKKPIPFRESRSPALSAYEVPRERWLAVVFLWLGFLFSIGLITGLTCAGVKRVEENPRMEGTTRSLERR